MSARDELSKLCGAAGLTMNAVYLGERTYDVVTDSKWHHDKWHVVLRAAHGREFETPYRSGVGNRKDRPAGNVVALVDVVASLCIDASSVEGLTFDEFCETMDQEGVAMLDTYLTCQKTFMFLRRALGMKQYAQAVSLSREI